MRIETEPVRLRLSGLFYWHRDGGKVSRLTGRPLGRRSAAERGHTVSPEKAAACAGLPHVSFHDVAPETGRRRLDGAYECRASERALIGARLPVTWSGDDALVTRADHPSARSSNASLCRSGGWHGCALPARRRPAARRPTRSPSRRLAGLPREPSRRPTPPIRAATPREPLIKAAVISGSPWVAGFRRSSATMISGVLCAEAGFRGRSW